MRISGIASSAGLCASIGPVWRYGLWWICRSWWGLGILGEKSGIYCFRGGDVVRCDILPLMSVQVSSLLSFVSLVNALKHWVLKEYVFTGAPLFEQMRWRFTSFDAENCNFPTSMEEVIVAELKIGRYQSELYVAVRRWGLRATTWQLKNYHDSSE